MEARVNHLKPTVFVNSVPELAAVRTLGEEIEQRGEAEELTEELAEHE